MKKFLLTCLSFFAVAAAYAFNYTVTVTTQKQIRYVDKDNNTVATEIQGGNALIFEVVADTPRQAENEALYQCQGACDSGIEIKAATNVMKNGKLCTKYIRTVPFKAEAKLKQ